MKHEKSMAATFTDEERHRLIAFLSNDIGKTQPYVYSSGTYSSSKSSNGHGLLIVVTLIISPRHLQHQMENVPNMHITKYEPPPLYIGMILSTYWA